MRALGALAVLAAAGSSDAWGPDQEPTVAGPDTAGPDTAGPDTEPSHVPPPEPDAEQEPEGPEPDAEPVYMTLAKARDVAAEPLPSSLRDIDSRLGIITGTSVFQLGRIDRMIPIALLNEDGDVSVAEAVPGSNQTAPISILDCGKELNDFALHKNEDLQRVMQEVTKQKGTVAAFRLIDDMKDDPGHPWVHSATYNKTAATRKVEAVAKVMQGWVDSVDKVLEEALSEYIPPFNASLEGATAVPPAPAIAWIEGYTQSTRIVLVAAQLLKKFGAKGMAEGLKLTNAPLAVPMNVKDYLDVMQLSAKKVAHRFKRAIGDMLDARHEAGQHPEAASSLLETQDTLETRSSRVDAAFSDVFDHLEDLRAAVMRETKAMKVGFLPKASSLLLAYGGFVNAINNANNYTRAALDLPPIFLSQGSTPDMVMQVILHGDMAKIFYGKKLSENQTVKDWGLVERSDGKGGTTWSAPEAVGAGSEYHELRDEYEKRTPGFVAYEKAKALLPTFNISGSALEYSNDTGKVLAHVRPHSDAVAVEPDGTISAAPVAT